MDEKKEKFIDVEKNEELIKLFEKYEEDIYVETETEETRAKINELLEAEEKFYESLCEEKKKEWKRIDDLKLKYDKALNKNIFIYGFRLAVKLILEDTEE